MISTRDDSPTEAPNVTREEPSRAAGDGAGAASLDKVRDILFGGQMRDVDRRFARLEERLLKETNDLREDIKRRLEAVERYARQESESLAGQIKAEHDDRVESANRLDRDLKDAAQALEKRISTLDDQLGRSQRELRQLMLEQHQQLSGDLRKKIDEVLAALARESQELRSDKTDRRALAAMLTEMAMRLNDEFRIPGAEDLGNG
jgi:DNA repair exonuclease SbcCD ATPase subunit